MTGATPAAVARPLNACRTAQPMVLVEFSTPDARARSGLSMLDKIFERFTFSPLGPDEKVRAALTW